MNQSVIEGHSQSKKIKKIPSLSMAPHWQMLEAILKPMAYYRRCFLHNSGVIRVKMSPTLPPQQVLISDPSVIKDLINEDGGRCISAPGQLNGLLSQVVGQHSIILLAPAVHRQRRKLLTPPFHGERLKAYGQLISGLAEQTLKDLKVGDVFDARERMQGITMRVILTAVFGLYEGETFRRI
jgi:cytochrome P450